MRPLVVVEANVGIYSRSGFTHALVGPEIHLLVLDGPPQSLHEDVQRECPDSARSCNIGNRVNHVQGRPLFAHSVTYYSDTV